MTLKDGSNATDRRLDRVHSGHHNHLTKYPLTVATLPAKRTAMPIGINWYSNFDNPKPIKVRGRTYQAIGGGHLGNVRGGHSTCLMAYGMVDLADWWVYYDQQAEGRCVEFACLRATSLHNRKRYDISSRWHYYEMQRRDYWPGGSYPDATPRYDGTAVDAGMQVLAQVGAIPARPKGKTVTLDEAPGLVSAADGIAAYRWATTWAMVRTALNIPDWLPGVPMLNSWGRDYPHKTLLLDAAGERVLREDGEMALITDK